MPSHLYLTQRTYPEAGLNIHIRQPIPSFPGMDKFRGDQHHSYAHPGPDAYQGKRCVVIGSNNSAFDICGALWESGADVTMVQRLRIR